MSDAYFGEFLPRQLEAPVHRNASFESPPSSILLSTLAARAHARAHVGANTGENPLTGDFSPTRKRALCCVFFPRMVGSIMLEIGRAVRVGGREKTDACWGGWWGRGGCLRGQRGCRSSRPKTIRAPTNKEEPVILRPAVITSCSFTPASTASARSWLNQESFPLSYGPVAYLGSQRPRFNSSAIRGN